MPKPHAGVVMLATGLGAAIAFRLLLNIPAHRPLPGGGFGELYGPVEYFRLPVYCACALLAVIGAAVTVAGTLRK